MILTPPPTPPLISLPPTVQALLGLDTAGLPIDALERYSGLLKRAAALRARCISAMAGLQNEAAANNQIFDQPKAQQTVVAGDVDFFQLEFDATAFLAGLRTGRTAVLIAEHEAAKTLCRENREKVTRAQQAERITEDRLAKAQRELQAAEFELSTWQPLSQRDPWASREQLAADEAGRRALLATAVNEAEASAATLAQTLAEQHAWTKFYEAELVRAAALEQDIAGRLARHGDPRHQLWHVGGLSM